MKKLFLACMAVAAVMLSSCEAKKNNSDVPGGMDESSLIDTTPLSAPSEGSKVVYEPIAALASAVNNKRPFAMLEPLLKDLNFVANPNFKDVYVCEFAENNLKLTLELYVHPVDQKLLAFDISYDPIDGYDYISMRKWAMGLYDYVVNDLKKTDVYTDYENELWIANGEQMLREEIDMASAEFCKWSFCRGNSSLGWLSWARFHKGSDMIDYIYNFMPNDDCCLVVGFNKEVYAN